VVGSLLVARWSVGLLRQTSRVLLDHQEPADLRERVRAAIEDEGEGRVVDLHVWSIGPGIRAACIAVVSGDPRPPESYKRRIPGELGLRHVTVEVHRADPDPGQGVA
jgi:Co/Zn/Cd efflux system component